MAANNILPFAQGGGANVQTQGGYAADAQRPIGNQPGVARADFNNKALLQASSIAVGVAQFLADKQATDVSDSLTGSALSTMFQNAVRAMLTGGAGTRSITAAATLTSADAGKSIALGGGSPYTVALPALSAMRDGDTLQFLNSNINTVSLARAGTDVIQAKSSTVASTGLGNGDTLILVASPSLGVWIAVGGSGQLSYSSQFNGSKSSNGWQILPSGLLIQWGLSSVGAGGAAVTTFPTAFPTACGSVVVSSANGTAGIAVGAFSVNTTGFTANSPTANAIFFWIAIGW